MANDNCTPCPMTSRIEHIEEDLRRNTDSHKNFYRKFEDSALAQARSDERQTAILQTVTEIKDTVRAMVDKPAKRWESVVSAIIAAVAGVVIGAILRGGIVV